MSHFKGRDIVSIDQLTTDEVLYLVDRAERFKTAKKAYNHAGFKGTPIKNQLRDLVLAYAFFEPSTRTRISFLRVAHKEGMDRVGFGSAESTSLKKNESIYHTLKMLEGYEADVLTIRHGLDGTAQYAADVLDIPVINAGDGKHEHPTQALLDLFSIKETQGRLDNLSIGLVGDLKYGRTPHSLMKLLRRFEGNRFYLVHPDQLPLPEEFTHTTDPLGERKELSDIAGRVSLDDALRKCNIVYMTRVQAERMHKQEREEMWNEIQLKDEMFKEASKLNPTLKILHPLPDDKEHPVLPNAFDKKFEKYAYYLQQAANGLVMRDVLFCAVLGVIGDDFKGIGYVRPNLSDKNTLIELPIGKQKKIEQFEIKPVHTGTVIDHIPTGMAVEIHRRVFEDKYMRGGIATSVPSKRMSTKDIMTLVKHELSEEELNIVAMMAPGVTINIVKDGTVIHKYRTQLPDVVTGQLSCKNSECISRDGKEVATSKFYTRKRNPAELQCHYCDTPYTEASKARR